MGSFLRENWIWILLPLLFAGAIVAYLVLSTSSDPAAPFVYTID
ncbi:MAG: DUF5989 family protein [Planctomycetota bacterium]|jgi:hypothetical protein|nr:DUF5989 family protein [Planctomycetota bacterium]MDP6839666.1 DUF5989 family protein [Planctomycetota bacterium]MDP6956182.1 DUF5989 family protein [Planctomycetota bacterium]